MVAAAALVQVYIYIYIVGGAGSPRVRYNNLLIIAQTFGGIFIYIFIFISTPLLYTHIYTLHVCVPTSLNNLIPFSLVTVVHL